MCIRDSVLIVPLIRETFGGTGSSMLAASLLLGLMILPTIIGVTEDVYKRQLLIEAQKKDRNWHLF